MNVYGSKYRTANDDFARMMNREEFSRAIFIFNDNEVEHKSAKIGAGNAKMRQFNSYSGKLPRSLGIPTGYYRSGYTSLDEKTKEVLDSVFLELEELLKTGNYDSIVYSIENEQNIILGTSIFSVNQEVLVYITKNILSFGEKYFGVKNGQPSTDFLEINEEFLSTII